MKNILASLIALFTFMVIGQSHAVTTLSSAQSIDSLSSPLICAEDADKKKKKKGEEEEEPECD